MRPIPNSLFMLLGVCLIQMASRSSWILLAQSWLSLVTFLDVIEELSNYHHNHPDELFYLSSSFMTEHHGWWCGPHRHLPEGSGRAPQPHQWHLQQGVPNVPQHHAASQADRGQSYQEGMYRQLSTRRVLIPFRTKTPKYLFPRGNKPLLYHQIGNRNFFIFITNQ